MDIERKSLLASPIGSDFVAQSSTNWNVGGSIPGPDTSSDFGQDTKTSY